MQSRTVSVLSSPLTRPSGSWMVTSTTLSRSPAIIIRTRGAPVRAASISVWPGYG